MQETVKSNTKLEISLAQPSNFVNIRLLDFTQDLRGKGDQNEWEYELLTPGTYSSVLTAAGFTESDRAMTMVSTIFDINKEAKIYFYAWDLSDDAADITTMHSSLDSHNDIKIHIDLVSATDKVNIESHLGQFKTTENSRMFYKYESASADTASLADIKTIRDEIGESGALFCDGTVSQNTDAALVAFMTKDFPHSKDLFGMELSGMVQNDFTQGDEDKLVGDQRGRIDDSGNGGVNAIVKDKSSRRNILWGGVLCNGTYISVDYFKRWLDFNLKFVVSNFKTDMSNAGIRITNDKDGAGRVEAVILSKILDPAARTGALLNDNYNPLNVNYIDSSTGERRKTFVEASFTGDVMNLKYELALTTPVGLINIENVITLGGEG